METNLKLYNIAKANIGNHLTLNDAIPAEFGCAECMSKILQLAGYSIPAGGISGSATLYEWLLKNDSFEKVDAPEQGVILISPSGYGNGNVVGHVGVVGKFGLMYPNDYAVISNNSNTGLLSTQWTLEGWKKRYVDDGGLPMAYFKAK
jgi:hypothetical protein